VQKQRDALGWQKGVADLSLADELEALGRAFEQEAIAIEARFCCAGWLEVLPEGAVTRQSVPSMAFVWELLNSLLLLTIPERCDKNYSVTRVGRETHADANRESGSTLSPYSLRDSQQDIDCENALTKR